MIQCRGFGIGTFWVLIVTEAGGIAGASGEPSWYYLH